MCVSCSCYTQAARLRETYPMQTVIEDVFMHSGGSEQVATKRGRGHPLEKFSFLMDSP